MPLTTCFEAPVRLLWGVVRHLMQMARSGQASLLRITCFTGLILLILTGGAFLYFRLLGGAAPGVEAETGFYRMLRDYDRHLPRVAGVLAGSAAQAVPTELENLSRELDKLERKAETAEYWLSVLKRRRQLAGISSRYLEVYRESARRAAAAYPWSQSIAAVAASALIRDTALTPAAQAELRGFLPLFADSSHAQLRISLHVLAGDFKNPVSLGTDFEKRRTALLDLSSAHLQDFSFSEIQAIAADLAMVKLLSGNMSGAAAEIQGLLSYMAEFSESKLPVEELLRFAAEYYYDFGSLFRSAELFSHIGGDEALLRQADALWLAGLSENARLLWALSDSPRSLYNLALTAPGRNEEAALLERLANMPDAPTAAMTANTDGVSDNAAGVSANAAEATAAAISRQYGLIRYSRLLAAPQALAILENAADKKSPAWPLADLETVKRRAEIQQTGRTVAETWLLLDRHPENEALYHWAAWYFDYQRNYNETALLLRNAARLFSETWVSFFTAVGLMRGGDLDSAGEILTALAADKNGQSAAAEWPAMANLGLIWEVNRSPARALEYYELAAAGQPDAVFANSPAVSSPATSRIQFHIARCFNALGRPQEARRALEYALDLNPGNLNARLELDRMER
jgi:tetratricopeptide (TPR) repeat protein